MKLLLILPFALLLAGCTIGGGNHIGYVTAVNDYFGKYVVFFKTDLSSSQEDKYCAESDMAEQLLKASEQKQRINIKYRNELWVFDLWGCGGESITNFSVVETK